jgi:pimeloyl-ACP methyl ester carboxylesterase
MMKFRFIVLLLIGIITVGLTNSADAADSRYASIECPFTVPLGLNVQCGYLTVPEDHDQPDGATIRLAVAILKSSSSSPEPDPLIFLQGGPGGSAIQLELLGAMPRLFTYVLRNRDVILLDQRGTGLSEPSLTCPEMVTLLGENTAPMIGGALGGEMLAALHQCRDRLESDGVHLGDYTTSQSAADVAMLREALSYEQVNLFGISYGTRLALEVMRSHPEGIRSVILDSTLPPNVDIVAEEAANTAQSFDQLFQRCQNDTMCQLAYPDLKDTFFNLVNSMNSQPLQFTAIHPRTELPIDVTLTGNQLVGILFGLLYSPDGVASIPALIYEIRGGEYDHLVKLILPQMDVRLAGLSSPAMQYSVICNDMLPLTVQPDSTSTSTSFFEYAGSFSSGEFQTLCADWDRSGMRENRNQPVVSDIPSLLLVGEMDHATPVIWAERAAATLSRSYLYVFPGKTHALMNTEPECMATISRDFLNAPDTAPNADCLGNLSSNQFVITAVATRPFAQASALLLGGVALWGVGSTGLVVVRRRRQFAWRMSFRMMGWIGIVFSIVGIVTLAILGNDSNNPFDIATAARVVEVVVPLVVGVQAAFAFSPDDEPGVEVLLACPRPISWLMLERLLVILFVQGAIGLVATVWTLNLSGEQDVWIALARWVPPALLFCGVGAYTTIRSRQPAFSIAIAGVIWFMFSFMGAVLLPGLPTFSPLNIIQPYLWPLHAFLQPSDMSMRDYWLNRAVVLSIGIGLVMLAMRQLRVEERVLTGTLKRSRE